MTASSWERLMSEHIEEEEEKNRRRNVASIFPLFSNCTIYSTCNY